MYETNIKNKVIYKEKKNFIKDKIIIMLKKTLSKYGI